MGRLIYIGMLSFMGVAFLLCTLFLSYSFKKIQVNGNPLTEEPVNETTRTDKMGIGEILLYALMCLIAIVLVLQLLSKGTRVPSVTSLAIRSILLIPIMAIFNARKRTGKALVALFASGFFLLFCTMAYFTIGLPVKAPVFRIDQTDLRLGETTVESLMKDGFEIYLGKGIVTRSDMREFPESEEFERYTGAERLVLPKGYHWQSSEIVPHSKGFLVKDGILLASVVFYGSMTEEIPLKECSIIHFDMNKDSVARAREQNIALSLNGIDLLSKLETERMKNTFGKKIFRPKQVEAEKQYLISWDTRSHHLFYNTYGANIEMDEEYRMRTLEFTCQIAREAEEF